MSLSDINECEVSNPCDENAKCSNTEGSFQCECNARYNGNGLICQGITAFRCDCQPI